MRSAVIGERNVTVSSIECGWRRSSVRIDAASSTVHGNSVEGCTYRSMALPVGIGHSDRRCLHSAPVGTGDAEPLDWRPWAIGAVVAAVILGPALGPGHLLNLDLVSSPDIQVPSWAWGLGPGLPHRVPSFVPLAWLSSLIGGAAAIKLVLVLLLILLFVGTWRLTRSGDRRIDAGVALIVTLSPFTTTRLAVGHLNVLAAMAVVAWNLPVLLRPTAEPRRTLLAATVAALWGLTPGSWVVAVVAVGLVAESRSSPLVPRLRMLAGVVAVQATWMVPSAIFAATGPGLGGSRAFRTDVGFLAPLQLLAGLGFWRVPSQVQPGPLWPLATLVVAAMVIAGWTSSIERFGVRGGAIVVVGVLVAVASSIPGVRTLYEALSGSFVGAPLREGHRAWGLALVMLAPTIGAGAVRLGRRFGEPTLAGVAPLAAAVVLGATGIWGVGGALRPVDYPSSWLAAAHHIRTEGGTALALPWHQYLDLGFDGARRTLNPLPDLVGGDVVSSTDPELGRPSREVDPRAPALLRALQRNDGVVPALVAGGIRWVMLVHEVDWDRYNALRNDPGLTVVVDTDDVTLLRVDGSETQPVDWSVRAVGRIATGGPTRPSAIPAQTGWLSGWSLVSATAAGTLDVARHPTTLWYAPAVLVVVGDAVTGGVLMVLGATAFRRRRLLREM